MASVTLTIPQADVADVAGAYSVSSTAEFKAVLLAEIKAKTRDYRNTKLMQAITPAVEPGIT